MNAIDTNVLVYAFDLDEADKGPRAIALIESLPAGSTILLWQVACELGGVLTRIGPRARNVADRHTAIESVLARFPLVTPRPEVFETAWQLRDAHQLSWWDGLLLAACIDAGITRLYTEDIQGKPIIGGVEIINPFV